jgi:CheY-like chemotaxis protein
MGVPAMMVKSPSLLITDDDPDFRETLRGVFAPRGFRTLLAGDGEEALEIVHTQEVHLVLLDVHMPKLTGLETLRLVKQFRALLPCILLSAQWDDGLIEQARSAQAFLILPKPITLNELTGAVRQALERTYHWNG